MRKLRPNCRIWCYAPGRKGVFGDGKFRLLEAIDRCGSLRAAAEELGMSYRKAWGDIQKAEACLQVKLALRSRGGTAGGRTVLTADAVELLAAYRRFRDEARRGLEKSFVRNMSKWS